MKKHNVLRILLAIILILTSTVVSFAQNDLERSAKNEYYCLVYDTFTGQKIGNLIIKEVVKQDEYLYLIRYDNKKVNVVVNKNQSKKIRSSDIYGLDSLKVDVNDFELLEIAKNEISLAGNFIYKGKNLAFIGGKDGFDEKAFLNWISENRRLSEEGLQNEFTTMNEPERGTVMNTRARLQCIGNSPIPLQTQAFRFRLQTRGVADSISQTQRVTRTFINPRTNTNLNFGGDQYPATSTSTFPVSISFAYKFFTVTLSYSTQTITYIDGDKSVSWTQNGSWTPAQMNYTGSDNSSAGHGARINIQPSSAAANSSQRNDMYAEYTVRTTGELWSGFDTYSISGHYWIQYN